ncbi:MAG: hypothetical protein V1685_04250 [Parcubacteria group bacterium]
MRPKNKLIIFLSVLLPLLAAAGLYFFFFQKKITPINNTVNQIITNAELPASRELTEADRNELGIPAGMAGVIKYTFDSEGRIVSYVEITSDTRPPDNDTDGIPDDKEAEHGTDPNNPDTDGDGWRDGDEVANDSDPTKLDTDGDGLGDLDEFSVYRTDVNKADTDGDGFDDRTELDTGFDPLGPGKIVVPEVPETPSSEGEGEVIIGEEPQDDSVQITPTE